MVVGLEQNRVRYWQALFGFLLAILPNYMESEWFEVINELCLSPRDRCFGVMNTAHARHLRTELLLLVLCFTGLTVALSLV